MNMPSLLSIRCTIERAWSINTGFCDDPQVYYRKDAAWEQCATTTALLQRKMGGHFMQGVAVVGNLDKNHYWLKIAGIDIDLTWRQFNAGTTLKNIRPAIYQDLIGNDWMESRLRNLATRYDLIENETKTSA